MSTGLGYQIGVCMIVGVERLAIAFGSVLLMLVLFGLLVHTGAPANHQEAEQARSAPRESLPEQPHLEERTVT